MPVIPAREGAGKKEEKEKGKLILRGRKRKFSQPVDIRLYVTGF